MRMNQAHIICLQHTFFLLGPTINFTTIFTHIHGSFQPIRLLQLFPPLLKALSLLFYSSLFYVLGVFNIHCPLVQYIKNHLPRYASNVMFSHFFDNNRHSVLWQHHHQVFYTTPHSLVFYTGLQPVWLHCSARNHPVTKWAKNYLTWYCQIDNI